MDRPMGTIRVLDQQVAAGVTHLFGTNKILDARVGLSRTKAGKYTLSLGNNAVTIPGLPTNPIVAGGLPSIGISGFSGFGRQSTNPQWQNPALLDPKVNFTYVKGRHSLKFGYEYEHVWMAVNDNNPNSTVRSALLADTAPAQAPPSTASRPPPTPTAPTRPPSPTTTSPTSCSATRAPISSRTTSSCTFVRR